MNEDLAVIEEAFNNTLSLDGTSPNQMTADLDLNGNQILNLPAPVAPTDVVRLQDLENYIDPIPYIEDQVALAEAAVTAAQLAETNAETAETNAETAETNAEAAQAQTLIYRDQSEAFRDETAIYAGTTNATGYYANTAAGLAATASGSYFNVVTTSSDGVQIYLDNAGSAVLQQTMPSINYIGKKQTLILLEYVSGTALSPVFRPVRPEIVLTGTAYGYIFEVVKWPFDKPTGSQNAAITQYDGTPWYTSTNIRDKDGTTQIAQGEILADDNVRWVRDPVTTVFRLITGPDKVTLKSSKATSANGPQGFLPSLQRPVMMTKVGPATWEIRVYKPVHHYENGQATVSINGVPTFLTTDRCQTDYDFYFLFDMASFQSDTYAPALNSLGCRRLDHEYRFAHHRMFDLISGVLADCGHVPSTMEAVLMSNDANDAWNGLQGIASNYQLSGIGHGHLESVSWTLYGTTNDATTSNVDVQSADLKDADIGTTFFGDKIVSTGVYYDESPTGERLCQRTMVHTFESTATHTCKVVTTLDPTVGGLEAPLGVRTGGYCGMFPMRNATRMRALKVNVTTGAVTEYGPIVTVNLQDESAPEFNLNLVGATEENWNGLEAWDHRQVVGGQVARARYVNNAGVGFTHWVGAVIDANRATRLDPIFVINTSWGSKGYDPWFGNILTKQDISTSVLTTSTAYLTIFGDLPV